MLQKQTSPVLPDLKIAWLLSFPNSGTSYTITLVQHVSKTNTASNYGHELPSAKLGISKPLYNEPTGPFWYESQNHPDYTFPTELALTKTHCGMRCVQCSPFKYVETTFSFARECASGRRVLTTSHGLEHEFVEYPTSNVTKAVHLIRNPFDNIVARFHLERRVSKSKNAADFDSSREGFREFCSKMNQEHIRDERLARFLDPFVLKLLETVPCRGDFIRYIEWHNLAFATTHDLGLETLVIHYDFYANRFEETTQELLNFLHLPRRGDPEPFIPGKVYLEYFTEEERSRVALALHRMASHTTWQHISRYFL
jgi:hypothetical protein